MFNKVGLCISTSAGAGEKRVTKDLKRQLFWMGVPKIYQYGKKVGASSWEQVKPEKRHRYKRKWPKLPSKYQNVLVKLNQA
jgi:hypothetical protein